MFHNVFTIATLSLILFSPISVSAHVVVKPSEVKPTSFERFVVGVPVEKEIPTTGLRLIMPEGLNFVTPFVKQGWNVEIKKDSLEKAKVTELIWTNGSIPAGQKDEFVFSAQTPATETNLKWKAYQTYSDGSVVNWDMESKSETNHSTMGEKVTPYSITKVITESITSTKDNSQNETLLFLISGLALLSSVATGILVGVKLKK